MEFVVDSIDDKGGLIQVANVKGGVGKSTVATHLASYLSKKGKTLVIDLDGQGSAASAFGLDPIDVSRGSFDLLAGRFHTHKSSRELGKRKKIRSPFKLSQGIDSQRLRPSEPLANVCYSINKNLDIISGKEDLFREYTRSHVNNLLANLDTCKEQYKYIVIDTPSQWNSLIKELFIESDLNLIPVTLNALVTRSLKNYLSNLKALVQDHSHIKIRIVKNEVYGTESSKQIGKVKTMAQNRSFLNTLVETVEYRSKGARLFLPESMVFDIEIPESAQIRNAQDLGVSVMDNNSSGRSHRAFMKLTQRVQEILNQKQPKERVRKKAHVSRYIYPLVMAKVALFLFVVLWNEPLQKRINVVPYAIHTIEKKESKEFKVEFKRDMQLYRVAKHAIAVHKAMVPSSAQVEKYVQEIVRNHNMMNPIENRIQAGYAVREGIEVTFFPPTQISNPKYHSLKPVYQYFLQTVDDDFAYVTGVWAERGTGGSPKHQGVDVASRLGAPIVSPVDGVAYVDNMKLAGRTVSIKIGNEVLLFAHCDERFVKNGEVVKKGDIIATVGMTGRTTGPHVHISYGVKFPNGTLIGKHRYKFTDPFLWYYKQAFSNRSS